MVRQLLDAARNPGLPVPKALIVPHAGYAYSGPVAASAYVLLKGVRGVSRVVLLGTSHCEPFSGLAVSGAEAFETPLGRVPIDREAVQRILELSQVSILERAHAGEHSIEVQLPFLQSTIGDFHLVPLAVSVTRPEEVAEVIERIWEGAETLVVVSSDLSHYHDYNSARRMDAETSALIERMQASELDETQACGSLAIGGLLMAASRKGLNVHTLDLRNSGDTAGPHDRVVGYGAYAFCEASSAGRRPLSGEAKRELLRIASESIAHGLRFERPLRVDPENFMEELRRPGAAFVTLKRCGELRGCIGSIQAHRPLAEDVAKNAWASAFRDNRFAPLSTREAGDLDIQISVLSEPEPLPFDSEADLLEKIRPGIDGLILEEGDRRGTLLPSMWEALATPDEFLGCLKTKAGLAEDYWSSRLKVFRFTTETFPG